MMNRLTSVIGPAPSERSPEDWLRRLGKERERVSGELLAFRSGLLTKGKRKTLKGGGVKKLGKVEEAKRQAFLTTLRSIGMTEEEYYKKTVKKTEDNEPYNWEVRAEDPWKEEEEKE
ncbi:hypothetical protein LCGC14_0739310 [marine sediment metagenome]|uniref:Uncharacterized protein n=1 Tax=marine sediment metagenome TaxID=412755 RepID=A0A0F9QBE4_9ZZZZ